MLIEELNKKVRIDNILRLADTVLYDLKKIIM